MATNIQVTAQTSQAVGAFNALANSIAAARGQLTGLNQGVNQIIATNQRFSQSLTTGVGGAFNRLTSIVSGFYDILTKIGQGIQLVFTSLIRELDKLQGFSAIMSVTTKNAEDAANSYDFLRKTADKLGVQFDALSGNYAKLVAALPEGSERMRVAEKAFMGVAMAARTLHSSNADTQLMFYAVTQIASKGVVSMEELRRQLGEKLPGTIQIAAKALNTIPEELEKAIRKGIVSSEKFLPIFGDALIRTFGGSAEKASQSVSASINRLTNVWVDFVKNVLDSGAGNSIINMFDALREKLSDPYLIERFSLMIKSLADRFTMFIERLTVDDIRNGFDTFNKAVEMSLKLIDKLIQGLTWVINNAPATGAAVGAIAGAVAGSVAGPRGAAVGLLAGAGAGYYGGTQLKSSEQDNAARAISDATAKLNAEQAARAREMLKMTQLIPTLQNFRGLNNLNGLDNLFKAEMLTNKTIQDLNTILKSKDYKTDKDRANAVREYSQYGTILGNSNATLGDVTTNKGNGKGAAAEERRMQATYNRGMGLTPTFFDEWNRLDKLFEKHQLTTNGLKEARDRLLDKQPIMIENAALERQEMIQNNKALQANIDLAFKQVQIKQDLENQLDSELAMAGVRQQNVQVESQMMNIMRTMKDADIVLTQTQIDKYRERLSLIERTQQATQAEAAVRAVSGGRYDNAYRQQESIDDALKRPDSRITGQQATDYTVMADSNMEGSQQWMEAQKRQLQEYYDFIDALRSKDRISEQTAQQAKAQASFQYEQARLQQSLGFFNALASLSQSGNKRIARIGKAAALTAATIDGYLAIQKALAAPPGWPYNAPMVVAVGIQQAANIARISSVNGFESGGYTGNVGRKDVAGVVHGQEYVVNADATAKNRSTLEAMNRGDTVGGEVKVMIYNYGSSKSFEVEQLSPSEVRVIARDEARAVVSRETPTIVAGEFSDPNSRVSKGLQKNYSVERAR